MVIFWRKVGAPALLCMGSEARIGSGSVVGTDDARGVNLSRSLSILSKVERSSSS